MDFSGTCTNQNINYQKRLDRNWVEYHQPSDMFPASNDHLDLNLITVHCSWRELKLADNASSKRSNLSPTWVKKSGNGEQNRIKDFNSIISSLLSSLNQVLVFLFTSWTLPRPNEGAHVQSSQLFNANSARFISWIFSPMQQLVFVSCVCF